MADMPDPKPTSAIPLEGMRKTPPRKWEYELINFDGGNVVGFQSQLKEMGETGWEMTESFQLHNVFFFVMKRENSDVPKEGK